ncbi:hypothetical protein KY290_038435 [Solanum tuberosum]|uniref:Sm domain-containing protein n=1 Tax=Solanum tuberosum TaxID=4113 RepID=A0ABQ7U246_SOLTU|nr:hypothetical protein KY285_037750 [Solanum tuberosum]KAH0739730.1 hypothetical protein KY290_038435 [Solanum tuberosum]
MLPLFLLKTAQGHPILKNGETYNGHLVNCDTWINIHLREVICTSKDGDRFWRMPECYIRGNTIKYLRVPDEVIDKVQEETKSCGDRKPPGVGGRGRGRVGRDKGAAGRQVKGIGRGMEDAGAKGRGKGGPGAKSGGKAYVILESQSAALHFHRIPEKLVAIRKVILRTLKLLFWGLLLQGRYFHDLDKLKYGVDMNMIRLCDILQNPNSVDFGKTLTVTCNVRGNLDPFCNAVGYIDRQILGINHIYPRPAWKRSKDHSSRLFHWIGMGIALLVLGIILHFTYAIPLNKQLYTFSYVCVTSGAAALVFSAFYILYIFLPLEWIGMNAMLVYVMAATGIFAGFINGWYYEDPHNTQIYWIKKHIFIGVWHLTRMGTLLYVIFAEILFWAIVAGLLH